MEPAEKRTRFNEYRSSSSTDNHNNNNNNDNDNDNNNLINNNNDTYNNDTNNNDFDNADSNKRRSTPTTSRRDLDDGGSSVDSFSPSFRSILHRLENQVFLQRHVPVPTGVIHVVNNRTRTTASANKSSSSSSRSSVLTPFSTTFSSSYTTSTSSVASNTTESVRDTATNPSTRRDYHRPYPSYYDDDSSSIPQVDDDGTESSIISGTSTGRTNITNRDLAKYVCRHRFISCVIHSFPLPKLKTTATPSYGYTQGTAPNRIRDSVITYEIMQDKYTTKNQPIQSQGISSIVSFMKKGKGLMWQNRTSIKLHYETTMSHLRSSIIPLCLNRGIPQYLFVDNKDRQETIIEDQNVVLFRSVHRPEQELFNNFHEKCSFQDIIRETCIPSLRTVVCKDKKRGNAGMSVGMASSQGTVLLPGKPHAEPQLLDGTLRYQGLFRLLSQTTFKLLKAHKVLDMFSDLFVAADMVHAPKQKFYQDKCSEICDGNIYLSLSFKVYIHHPDNIENHNEHFSPHRDSNNPHYQSTNDIMLTIWDTWYEERLRCYVTGTMIACGRRSAEELYDRMHNIDLATERILLRYYQIPLVQRELLYESIAPPIDSFGSSLHFMKTFNLSLFRVLTPNHYIDR